MHYSENVSNLANRLRQIAAENARYNSAAENADLIAARDANNAAREAVYLMQANAARDAAARESAEYVAAMCRNFNL